LRIDSMLNINVMSNNKTRTYLISGVFLTFYGLKDLGHFYVFYDGIALALGITALVLAGIEYKKKIDQEKKDKIE
jgi:hypothetical protein